MASTSTLSKQQTMTQMACAVLTATGVTNGALKDLSASLPQSLSLIVNVSPITGLATVDVKLQGTNDGGGTYTDLVSATQFAVNASATIQRLDVPAPGYRAYRVVVTGGGTWGTQNVAVVPVLIGDDPSYIPVTQV